MGSRTIFRQHYIGTIPNPYPNKVLSQYSARSANMISVVPGRQWIFVHLS